MGGFVGLRVAIKYPEVLKSLTLIDTSSDEEANKFKYKLLNILASWFGLKSVIDKVTPIMFSKSFLNDPKKKETLEHWKQVVINNHPVGVKRSVNGVIARDGIADKIHQIKMPTLIIVGENDVATIPSKSEKMNSMIKGSKLEIIPDVGHMSVIENPGSVTELMEKFLRSIVEIPAK
jgi:pimeloyl-ACP methyl ester carboxylesterase